MRKLNPLRLYCSAPVFRLLLLAGLFVPALASAQVQGNYTINSNQPTAGRNFESFTDAVIFMANGISGAVTFDVAPGSGPYVEQVFLNYRIRSSATRPVVFNCNGVTLTFNSTNSMARAGIKIDSVDFVTFEDLKIVPTGLGGSEYGVGIHLVHDADHNVIRNCTITNQSNMNVPQNNEGIVINGSDDFSSSNGASNCDSNLIINNTISGGNAGITISAVPNSGDLPVMVKGNQLIDNKISDSYVAGIYLLYTDGTIMQGNDITGGVHAYDASGIRCYERNTNLKIVGNKIHRFFSDPTYTNNSMKGIEFGGAVSSPGEANLIANNLIYDFAGGNGQQGIVAQYSGSYLNIYHNTISLDDRTVLGTGETSAIYLTDYTGVNIYNNIITVNRTTTGRNYGINIRTTIPLYKSDRNLFYVVSGSTTGNAVGYQGNTQTTLAAWQTRTGNDLSSASSDPKFRNAANFDFMPTDSAIDNMGMYVDVNNDILGAIRHNTHPDVGAYEFLTPTCIGPVAGGAATMLPATTICQGSPMYLNLVNNSFGTNQTYQWQSSATVNGTYTNVGNALAHPALTTLSTSTLYYRAAVTCGSLVEYSTPIQIIVNPYFPSGTYTINSAIATGGTNFQSYTDAINSLRCGIAGPVVFNVQPGSGPYNEKFIATLINNVSAVNTVTFNGNGTRLIMAAGTSAERAIIKLNGAKYFIFDNIQLEPQGTTSGQYGIGVQMLNDADHNILRNCKILMSTAVGSTDLCGIAIVPAANTYTGTSAPSFCDSNTITNNTIIGGNYSITCTSADGSPATGNRFTNNIMQDFRSYGIWISGSEKALIEGNDISRPTRTTQFNGFTAIYVNYKNNGLVISKNKIHDPYTGARNTNSGVNAIYNNDIYSNAGETVLVSNNLIYNINGIGQQNGLFNSGAHGVKYYFNTVSLEETTASTQVARGVYNSSEARGLEFRNNMIVIKRNGTGAKYCININDANTTFTSDYNNLVMASTTGTSNFIGRANGSDYQLMNAWQQNTSNDANSFSLYPNFAAPATADFTPTLLDLENKGITIPGITTDLKGTTRRTTKPDIGAFEFTICYALGAGPTVTADSIATDLVRFSWPAVTNATGYLVSTDGTNFVIPSSGPTGRTHTIAGINGGTDVRLTVRALGSTEDCATATANPVTARTLCLILGTVATPTIDNMTTTTVSFSWAPVANAVGYKVSTDGVNYVTPSSGATGLTHTVTGVTPGTDVVLYVQAQNISVNCPTATSQRATAHVPGLHYFVPNMFSPNGNGKNDFFTVECNVISTMRLMVFNQWGEKIFETSSQRPGWDGTYKGKQQPVGVYVYILTMTLEDGSVVNKKGTINLIR